MKRDLSNEKERREYSRLMSSKRWVRLRRRKLTDTPLCEMCSKEGRHTLATVVHHIKPIEGGVGIVGMEALAYSYGNLMSLCQKHHVEVHKDLGSFGAERQKRRHAAEMEDFKRKFLNPDNDEQHESQQISDTPET